MLHVLLRQTSTFSFEGLGKGMSRSGEVARAPSPPPPARSPCWSQARGRELFRLRNTLKGNPHTRTPCAPAVHWNPPGSARKGLYYARTANEIQTSNQSHHAESRQPGPGVRRNTEDFPVRRHTLLLKGSRALAR